MVWLVDLQYVTVAFYGLLVLRIALSIAAYPMLYLTIAFRLKKNGPNIAFKSGTALTNIFILKIVDSTIMCILFHEHHK